MKVVITLLTSSIIILKERQDRKGLLVGLFDDETRNHKIMEPIMGLGSMW